MFCITGLISLLFDIVFWNSAITLGIRGIRCPSIGFQLGSRQELVQICDDRGCLFDGFLSRGTEWSLWIRSHDWHHKRYHELDSYLLFSLKGPFRSWCPMDVLHDSQSPSDAAAAIPTQELFPGNLIAFALWRKLFFPFFSPLQRLHFLSVNLLLLALLWAHFLHAFHFTSLFFSRLWFLSIPQHVVSQSMRHWEPRQQLLGTLKNISHATTQWPTPLFV
jgi:hypothetical protein